jgi:hypothetical protein
MERRRVKLHRVLAMIVALASACSDGTGPSEIAGRYELKTVNGVALPATVNLGGTVTIAAGFFQLEKDGSFTFGYTETGQLGGQSFTQEISGLGLWVQTKNTVQFKYQDGSTPEIGTISGRDMAMRSAGLALVFRR